MDADQLSEELRLGSGNYLAQRRWVAGLSIVASAAMGAISLYQLGIIRHMPEPRLPHLDEERVDGSSEAYSRLATPDGTLGMASYALTLVLAAMAGAHRSERHPWVALLFGAKLLFDAATMARMVLVQTRKLGAYGPLGLVAAGSTLASLPIAVPEVVHAARALLGGGKGRSGDACDVTAT
jgi:hypothetical protein